MKILLVVLLVAVLVYGFVRLLERRSARRNATPKPVAPDDDLDFLRNLEWQQRKDRQRRRKDQDADSPDGGRGPGPEDATDGADGAAAPDVPGTDPTAPGGQSPDEQPDATPERDEDGPRP